MSFDIEFRSVTFKYEGAQAPALRDVTLTISPGEIVLISGPAGSGKTTLCNCMTGLIPHFHEGTLEGDVFVRKYNTRKARIGGLASLVGMVFQDPESQLVTSSVVDEVAFGPENLGIAREEINKRVSEALKATRLQGYDDREPYTLSGGEQQACVIAAIYAMYPEIYVMDEPLANLDPEGKAQVLRVVVDLAKNRGKTLILVEHALEEVLPLVDRVIVMEKGRIVRDGSVSEVLAAGDIPSVFIRPPVVRLGEEFKIDPLPLNSDQLHRSLTTRYRLGTIQWEQESDRVPDPGTPAIQFNKVSYAYKKANQALNDFALKDIDLTINTGEFVAILGRNGSGKTTLIRHIIGLLQPDHGEVHVLDQKVASTPTHQLARRVGFCFQNPNHQIVSFNVRDEIIFGLKAHGVDPSEYEERIHKSLEFVNMLGYADAEIFDLGKGQKQRVALASVLSLDPEILIVDEPTTGQDPHMSREIFEIIDRLHKTGTTVLMITHQIDYAAIYAQRAIVLKKGRVDFDGPVLNLLLDQELMQAASLEMPELTRLAKKFSRHGVPGWLVKMEDLDQAIRGLIEAAHDD